MRDLAPRLTQLKAQSLYRRRLTLDSPQDTHISVEGQPLISFCSNDYLGLANHPDVIQAFQQGVQKYGVGSGASHLVTGHSRAHDDLEEALAAFTGYPRALLFSSGYMANLAAQTTLAARHDVIYQDRLNHASLIDAAHLSKASLQRYAHLDSSALNNMLGEAKLSGNKNSLVVSDGVFSMDGDIAPVPELLNIASAHHSFLIIDDAHGIGVLGENGRGCLEHFNIHHTDDLILVGTLGKAFGTFGAFVAASDDVIETLIQKGRSYIYTTALPPAVACATLASLKLIQQDNERREKLAELIVYFKTCAEQIQLPLMPSNTAIQPLLMGDAEQALSISQSLRDQGFLVTAIRPPTVAEDTARLRITLSANHRHDDINALLEALSTLL